MVKEFNHIGVNVKDLQKTLAFYSRHFGARITRDFIFRLPTPLPLMFRLELR